MKKVSISESDLKIVMEALKTGKVTVADILVLINKKDNQTKKKTDEVILTIDYSRNLEEMIKAGKYDWINGDITEKLFPLPVKLNDQKVSVLIKLFHFNHPISSKDVIIEMDKVNCRPATLAELLALGETFFELQKKFPIVALGSIGCSEDDSFCVPILGFDDDKRRLYLSWLGLVWSNGCRFLGIQK